MAEKIQKIIEEISSLTVLELNELIKALEDKFGVQAISFQASPSVKSKETDETSAVVDIILTDAGSQKLNVIKLIREINQNLSLKDAKDIIDNLPQKIAEKVDRKKADELKKKFEEAGAKVEIK